MTVQGESLKLVRHEKRAIHWFIWNYSARLMMLCSGKDYSCIQCFQFLPDRLMKIPDFDPEVSDGSAPGFADYPNLHRILTEPLSRLHLDLEGRGPGWRKATLSWLDSMTSFAAYISLLLDKN